MARTPPGSLGAYTIAAAFALLVALAALLVPVRRALAAQPARELERSGRAQARAQTSERT